MIKMKKMMIGMMFAAAAAVLGASGTFADGVDKVDIQGIHFSIPEEIRDLVTVKTEGLEADALVSVYETASLDAAKARGEEDNSGAGWIFSITTVPEGKMKELRCGGMDGMEVFAENDDLYYVYDHPTDVRMVRESNEEMDKGIEQWSKINEWAGQEVRQEILANNPELEAQFYTNTNIDMCLAQALYKPGTKYELRSVDFGPDPLDPATLGENDYLESLTEDFTYQILSDAKEPAGEYYVLAMNIDDEEVRFDFFKDPENPNLVREVRKVGEEENTTFYQANAKEADDANKTVTGIMKAWCEAVATGREVDDD